MSLRDNSSGTDRWTADQTFSSLQSDRSIFHSPDHQIVHSPQMYICTYTYIHDNIYIAIQETTQIHAVRCQWQDWSRSQRHCSKDHHKFKHGDIMLFLLYVSPLFPFFAIITKSSSNAAKYSLSLSYHIGYFWVLAILIFNLLVVPMETYEWVHWSWCNTQMLEELYYFKQYYFKEVIRRLVRIYSEVNKQEARWFLLVSFFSMFYASCLNILPRLGDSPGDVLRESD